MNYYSKGFLTPYPLSKINLWVTALIDSLFKYLLYLTFSALDFTIFTDVIFNAALESWKHMNWLPFGTINKLHKILGNSITVYKNTSNIRVCD